eukprot:3712171-Rhodomonas_salina.1
MSSTDGAYVGTRGKNKMPRTSVGMEVHQVPSAYGPVMRCPVLARRTVLYLRTCDTVPGTVHRVCAYEHAMLCPVLRMEYSNVCLRARYAMSGIGLEQGDKCLAMSGTDLANQSRLLDKATIALRVVNIGYLPPFSRHTHAM